MMINIASDSWAAAQQLLGWRLVRQTNKGLVSGIIVEAEAYDESDAASHSYRGRTKRNDVMFGPPGRAYVYFTYGMHWMLNIVTEQENYPAAVLIRGVKSINGPGRLTKFFKVDKNFNGKPANRKTGLWIEDRGVKISPRQVKRGKRIGVDYAGEWKNKPWRFSLWL